MFDKKSPSNEVLVIPAPSSPDDLLTVREAAAELHLSESTIRAWILKKTIPYVKLKQGAVTVRGGSVRIRRLDITEIKASSLVPAKPNGVAA